MSPGDLLAGPRGRRLCSELALDTLAGIRRAEQRVRDDAIHAVEQVLPGPGAEVAIFDALRSSTDAARYWQDPDEDDILLADPRFAEQFRPLANAIAEHPVTQWWSTGLDPGTQVHTVHDRVTGPRAMSRPAAGALGALHTEIVGYNEHMRLVRSKGGEQEWAITSGTWWTPPICADLLSTSRSHPRLGPVGLSVQEDFRGGDQARTWPVTLPPAIRVFEIDGPSAWAELVRRYPMDVTFARGANWLQATGRDGAWSIPDWQAVAQDYDGVHLTVMAYLTFSGQMVDIDADRASFIAGWDPDQTYWLTDVTLDLDNPVLWIRDEKDEWKIDQT